ncbi:MAG TPA: plastocyanin/azurin family copper-binding protein [Rhodanobacteraceae bacterium]|nr:plastocyanin/azurin family copper-binding protein [Rhodanobacteraceae bacterium]
MRSFSKPLTIGIAAALGLIAGSAQAVNHNVTVAPNNNPFSFSPATLSIAAGDTVTWTYAGGGTPHNVQSDPDAVTQFRCANGCDGDGGNGTPTGSAWTATVAFPTAGTVGYYCVVHGAPGGVNMAGTITVTVPVDLQSFEVD